MLTEVFYYFKGVKKFFFEKNWLFIKKTNNNLIRNALQNRKSNNFKYIIKQPTSGPHCVNNPRACC